MVWTKGQSGNPAGRAKLTMADGRTVAEAAREHTEKALNTLVAVMDDDDAPAIAKAQAANALLDRAWGKPHQAIELDVTVNESAATQLEAARKRAREALTGPGARVIEHQPN